MQIILCLQIRRGEGAISGAPGSGGSSWRARARAHSTDVATHQPRAIERGCERRRPRFAHISSVLAGVLAFFHFLHPPSNLFILLISRILISVTSCTYSRIQIFYFLCTPNIFPILPLLHSQFLQLIPLIPLTIEFHFVCPLTAFLYAAHLPHPSSDRCGPPPGHLGHHTAPPLVLRPAHYSDTRIPVSPMLHIHVHIHIHTHMVGCCTGCCTGWVGWV